jgi:hypothetical protein
MNYINTCNKVFTGINMNYLKIYNQLVEKAKTRVLECYTEKHHILPKCIGGDDSINNLVSLTPEEHFLAHQLLVKIYPHEDKLVYACNRMTQHNTFNRLNNKMYGWLKKKKSEVVSRQMRRMWETRHEELAQKLKQYANSDEGRKQRSISSKLAWKNSKPERKEQIKSLQKQFNIQVAERNKELWQTEEYRLKMANRKTRGSDGSKLKEKWADPIWRQKMLEARKKK